MGVGQLTKVAVAPSVVGPPAPIDAPPSTLSVSAFSQTRKPPRGTESCWELFFYCLDRPLNHQDALTKTMHQANVLHNKLRI
eukprot:1696319-Amphidinium_carterae.1